MWFELLMECNLRQDDVGEVRRKNKLWTSGCKRLDFLVWQLEAVSGGNSNSVISHELMLSQVRVSTRSVWTVHTFPVHVSALCYPFHVGFRDTLVPRGVTAVQNNLIFVIGCSY